MKKAIHFFGYPITLMCFLACSFFLLSCEGEDETIPAYITINDFEVEVTNPNQHGSVSHKITNASVFLIPKNSLEAPHQLGNVSLPATVPALVNGEYEINVDPVIKANGNSLFLQVYPFYERFKKDITLAPNEDVVVNPKSRYTTEAKFLLIEGFESSGHLFQTDRDNNFATYVAISDEDVFEGNASGKVELDTANNVFVVATAAPYEINFPESGKVYMEVNYKTDVPLEFGVISVNVLNDETPNFEFIVLPKSEWNKIYFDMTQLLESAPDNNFVFVIRGGIPIENGQFTMNSAEVFLDNIKVLSY